MDRSYQNNQKEKISLMSDEQLLTLSTEEMQFVPFWRHARLFYLERFNINMPLCGTKLFDVLYRLYNEWAFSCFSGRTKENLIKQSQNLLAIENKLKEEGFIL
jgi:hypothetical protein